MVLAMTSFLFSAAALLPLAQKWYLRALNVPLDWWISSASRS
jgi:hypothetical protein